MLQAVLFIDSCSESRSVDTGDVYSWGTGKYGSRRRSDYRYEQKMTSLRFVYGATKVLTSQEDSEVSKLYVWSYLLPLPTVLFIPALTCVVHVCQPLLEITRPQTPIHDLGAHHLHLVTACQQKRTKSKYIHPSRWDKKEKKKKPKHITSPAAGLLKEFRRHQIPSSFNKIDSASYTPRHPPPIISFQKSKQKRTKKQEVGRIASRCL